MGRNSEPVNLIQNDEDASSTPDASRWLSQDPSPNKERVSDTTQDSKSDIANIKSFLQNERSFILKKSQEDPGGIFRAGSFHGIRNVNGPAAFNRYSDVHMEASQIKNLLATQSRLAEKEILGGSVDDDKSPAPRANADLQTQGRKFCSYLAKQ